MERATDSLQWLNPEITPDFDEEAVSDFQTLL
jgi:hypothetical protein